MLFVWENLVVSALHAGDEGQRERRTLSMLALLVYWAPLIV
jgi:hypothetical protein